jgi:hypothetical protein
MILDQDIVSDKGMPLLAKGQEITMTLLVRLQHFSRHTAIREPIRVLVALDAAAITVFANGPGSS